MREWLAVCFCVLGLYAQSQSVSRLRIKGQYDESDSLVVARAYSTAQEAVELMYEEMEHIWYVAPENWADRNAIREQKWRDSDHFVTWLGAAEQIKRARKRILRIRKRLSREVTLHITKQNRGRCKGWISAWTIPYGAVRITLCEDFFIYRTHLQDKVIVHEIGHEAGMPFHRHIHGCRAARRAALSDQKNIAKRSPEIMLG